MQHAMDPSTRKIKKLYTLYHINFLEALLVGHTISWPVYNALNSIYYELVWSRRNYQSGTAAQKYLMHAAIWLQPYLVVDSHLSSILGSYGLKKEFLHFLTALKRHYIFTKRVFDFDLSFLQMLSFELSCRGRN